MTRLTRCQLSHSSRTFLPPALLLRLALLLILALSLALGQVQLRFATRDVEIETAKLQQRKADLLNARKRLVADVERLQDFEHLREYAEADLGLELCPPERSHRVALSVEAVHRWRGSDYAIAAAPGEQDLLARLGEKVVSWSSVSQARETEALAGR